jgi:hypothetical protein
MDNYVVQCKSTACVLGIYKAENKLEAYKAYLEETGRETTKIHKIKEDIKINLVFPRKLSTIQPAHVFVYDLEGEGFWASDPNKDENQEVYLPDEL